MKLIAVIDDSQFVVGYAFILFQICRELARLGHKVYIISKAGGAIQRLIGSTPNEVRIKVPSTTLLGSVIFVIAATAITFRKCLSLRCDAILTPVSFEAIPSLAAGKLCRTKVIGLHYDWYSLDELLSLHRDNPLISRFTMALGYFLILIILRLLDGLLCANDYHAQLLKQARLVRYPLMVVGLPIYGEINDVYDHN